MYNVKNEYKNNKVKREELIEIVEAFFSEVKEYNIFEIPDTCYLRCFENLKNKLNQYNAQEDDRSVTYGRLSFLKEELTKRLADEELKKPSPNWKNKWDNRMGAFVDLSDYIRGNSYFSLNQIPKGKIPKDVMDKNDGYYRNGFICKEEKEILLEMIDELEMFIKQQNTGQLNPSKKNFVQLEYEINGLGSSEHTILTGLTQDSNFNFGNNPIANIQIIDIVDNSITLEINNISPDICFLSETNIVTLKMGDEFDLYTRCKPSIHYVLRILKLWSEVPMLYM